MAESSCMSFDTESGDEVANLGLGMYSRTGGMTAEQEPRHPEFRSFQQRLESFTLWRYEAIVSCRALAMAGFFFTIATINAVGKAYAGTVPEMLDHTTCYVCGSSLQAWQKGDDPGKRHSETFFNSCLADNGVAEKTELHIEESVIKDHKDVGQNILRDNTKNSKSEESGMAAGKNVPVLELLRDALLSLQPTDNHDNTGPEE